MNNKVEALAKLYEYREQIEDNLANIDAILQIHFPNEYSVAYQHWFPQILTALNNNTKWLPRGQYNMEYTLQRIEDSLQPDGKKGVSKYI